MTSTKTKEVTIEITQGDSEDMLITVKTTATPQTLINLSEAVDGTPNRPAVIRFAVKKDPASETNVDATIFKATYFANQIAILPQSGLTLGQAKALIDKMDTVDAEAGAYRWDIEVTRQDFLRTQAGLITVTTGSNVVNGAGTNFSLAKEGDILQITTGISNPLPVLIKKIVSPTQLQVESALFQAQVSASFEIRRGKHKTPTRGPFNIVQSVVSE